MGGKGGALRCHFGGQRKIAFCFPSLSLSGFTFQPLFCGVPRAERGWEESCLQADGLVVTSSQDLVNVSLCTHYHSLEREIFLFTDDSSVYPVAWVSIKS